MATYFFSQERVDRFTFLRRINDSKFRRIMCGGYETIEKEKRKGDVKHHTSIICIDTHIYDATYLLSRNSLTPRM